MADRVVVVGVDHEPLLRRDLPDLVRRLADLPSAASSHVSGQAAPLDLALTTNGSLLAEKAEALRGAGLRRINVSIDTLDPEKFRRITRRGDLGKVLEGLFAAKKTGFKPIKINAVIERGANDDDILSLAEFSREHGFPIRFIEYMDVGNTNNWTSEKLVSKKEILEVIASRYPLREVGRDEGSAPSVDYEFCDGAGQIGVIASVTEPFCSTCTRARLTADGKLVTCLFSQVGHDLKALLRNGTSDEGIREVISAVWTPQRAPGPRLPET